MAIGLAGRHLAVIYPAAALAARPAPLILPGHFSQVNMLLLCVGVRWKSLIILVLVGRS